MGRERKKRASPVRLERFSERMAPETEGGQGPVFVKRVCTVCKECTLPTNAASEQMYCCAKQGRIADPMLRDPHPAPASAQKRKEYDPWKQ
jgi:hypothetical protein